VIADRPTLVVLARIAGTKSPAELAQVQPDAYGLDVTWDAWCRRSEALAGRSAGQPDLAAEARRHAIALASTAMGRPVSAREAAAWTFGRDARIAPDRRPPVKKEAIR
jgi:hypothetical protein